jgi:SAM-dependent methyltransferase
MEDDMSNEEMVRLWNSPASRSWVDTPERYDAMLGDLGQRVLEAADLRPGERVLDVGCGSGQLTLQAAQQVGPQGAVTGVDVSAALVELGRVRATQAGAVNVTFLEADAQVQVLQGEAFEVLLSRFGVMFFADPVAAFTRLRGAMSPQGRLAFVAWQSPLLNAWATTPIAVFAPILGPPDLPAPGAPGPFAFADPERIHEVLGAAGWKGVGVQPLETSVLVGGPGTVEHAVDFYCTDTFGSRLLAGGTPEQRESAVTALRDTLVPLMGEQGLRLGAAVWVVTAAA